MCQTCKKVGHESPACPNAPSGGRISTIRVQPVSQTKEKLVAEREVAAKQIEEPERTTAAERYLAEKRTLVAKQVAAEREAAAERMSVAVARIVADAERAIAATTERKAAEKRIAVAKQVAQVERTATKATERDAVTEKSEKAERKIFAVQQEREGVIVEPVPPKRPVEPEKAVRRSTANQVVVEQVELASNEYNDADGYDVDEELIHRINWRAVRKRTDVPFAGRFRWVQECHRRAGVVGAEDLDELVEDDQMQNGRSCHGGKVGELFP
jgi:hypothetical protein